MEPIVYLPVEIKPREFPARLLIAGHLLRAGYAVVLGQYWALKDNGAALPPGLHLFKSVNKIQATAMQMLRDHGHIVAASDEEVLNLVDVKTFGTSCHPLAAENCELFFAQSEQHRDAIEKKHPRLAGRVQVVGNPRLDLLAHPYRRLIQNSADHDVEAYKPYILFNTNFVSLNSLWNKADIHDLSIEEQAGLFDGSPEERERKVAARLNSIAWEKNNYDALVALLQWTVRKLRKYNIVLRPHPGERPEHWIKALAQVPNALVVPRSDPHPWVLGAEIVVHTGCTTGLEAALLDKPSLNLLPADLPGLDRIVTYVNPTFRTWEDAAEALRAFLTTGEGPIAGYKEKKTEALRKYLPTHENSQAAQLMADAIAEELKVHGAAPRQDYQFALRSPLNMKERTDVQADKFSASLDEVCDGFEAIHPSLAEEVEVQTLGDSLFLMTRVPQ